MLLLGDISWVHFVLSSIMLKSPGKENPSFNILVFCGNVRAKSPDGKGNLVMILVSPLV